MDESEVDAGLEAGSEGEGETTVTSDDTHTGRLRTFKFAFVAN